jgi:hypothetical protein
MQRRLLLPVALCATLLPAQIPDFKPSTPLLGAALHNDVAAMHTLLTEKADPNEGRFFGSTALTLAVIHGNLPMVRDLLDHGADCNLADGNGNTPLMWAAGAETPQAAMVEELLGRGARPGEVNKYGESAMTWATRRGNMEMLERLRAAGANDRAAIRQAAEKAIALLQASGPQFVKASGCTSCHHQSLPQMVYGAARRRGFAMNDEVSAGQVKAVMAMFRPIRAKLIDGSMSLPNPGISVSYSLLGLEAEGYAPDETTAAMATAILRTQRADGSFGVLPARPPLEASAFTSTALSIRALNVYGEKGEKAEGAVGRGRRWLAGARPATGEDRAMRLLGLAWGKAPKVEIDGAVRELLGAQRPDGGWAQLAGMEADAYATGESVTALLTAGVEASHPAVARGVAYLLRTQMADGSWLVRTRSNPLQPMRESGFPHGRDQWISAAGTSWAALALTMTQPDAVLTTKAR